jgi:3-phenylpropionate/cinnamic acid dioxygenase small subunit
VPPEQQIKNLIYRYAELLDDGDIDGVAQLLGRARFIGPDGDEQGSGIEAIKAIYSAFLRVYPDGTPLCQHVTTNVILEISGDEAAARSCFTVLQATPDLPLQPIMAGRYHDRFRRDAQGWHFSSRQMLPRLAGDLSAHLLQGYQ